MNRLLLIAISMLVLQKIHGQLNTQLWFGLNAGMPLTEKLSGNIGTTRAYSLTDSFANTFNQYNSEVDYRLNKKVVLSGGIQVMNILSRDKPSTRVYVRVAHTTKLEKLNWTNSLRLETNSKIETRFRHRIILNTRIAARKRISSLKILPSLSYAMFYNIGGNPIRYYDANEVLIARQSPDGFHRGRLTFNLNYKLTKQLRLNTYIMRQQEFNFLTKETRKMNVYDPVRNRILRPFNNYTVLGLSLSISLDEFIQN